MVCYYLLDTSTITIHEVFKNGILCQYNIHLYFHNSMVARYVCRINILVFNLHICMLHKLVIRYTAGIFS